MSECLLCNLSLETGKVVTVSRGIDTIIKASIARGDGLEEALKQTHPLTVHEQCRKNYTRPSSIKSSTKSSTVSHESHNVTTRASALKFDFEKSCIICGNEADGEKEKKLPQKYRRTICEISTLDLINNLKCIAEQRGDDLGKQVKERLSGIIDLVAAEGRYHRDCYSKFLQVSSKGTAPQLNKKDLAFQKICTEIESGEECQYLLSEISERMSQILDGAEGYTTQYLKQKLVQHFGKNVIITSRQNQPPIVCFRETVDNIIHKNWYQETLCDKSEERLRIVSAAAAIIREDIRSQAYDLTSYSIDGGDIGENDIIPQTLQCFTNVVIQSKSDSQNAQRKRQSISEAIISACRPRSFISPILLGIGVYMHRHFASRNIIDILCSLGFSVAYSEVQKLENCLKAAPEEQTEEAFIQFVFDNADFNIRTIDGNNTFHNMGGIKIDTPKIHKTKDVRVKRSNEKPLQISGRMKILTYTKPQKKGLTQINVRDLDILKNQELSVQSVLMDYLWILDIGFIHLQYQAGTVTCKWVCSLRLIMKSVM